MNKTREQQSLGTVGTMLRNWFWLACGLIGLGGTAATWLLLPREREVSGPLEFIIKIVVYLLLIAAIAAFPRCGGRWTWLSVMPFVAFTGYVIPRISYYYYFDREQLHAGEFYTHLYLLLYPGIVLTTALALRVGGAAAGRVVKVAVMGMLIVFSGFLDVMWQLVNPLDHIAETLDAPHIVVIVGRPVSFTEAIWFTVAHVPLAVLLACLPLQRWMQIFDDQPDEAPPGAGGTQPPAVQPGGCSLAENQHEPGTAADGGVNLSVVAPAYNEEAGIGQVVDEWVGYLDTSNWVRDWEIVVCNDGSSDDTHRILAEKARTIPQLHVVEHAQNLGAGAAIATAIAASTKDWVVLTDSDGQFPLSNLERFRPAVVAGAHAVSGCRVNKRDSFVRRLGSRMSGAVCNMTHSTSYRDFNSIFKMMPGEMARSMTLESCGLSCSTEIMSNLILRGVSWTEVEIEHRPRASGRSSWGLWKGARDRYLFVRYLATRVRLIHLGLLRLPVEVMA